MVAGPLPFEGPIQPPLQRPVAQMENGEYRGKDSELIHAVLTDSNLASAPSPRAHALGSAPGVRCCGLWSRVAMLGVKPRVKLAEPWGSGAIKPHRVPTEGRRESLTSLRSRFPRPTTQNNASPSSCKGVVSFRGRGGSVRLSSGLAGQTSFSRSRVNPTR